MKKLAIVLGLILSFSVSAHAATIDEAEEAADRAINIIATKLPDAQLEKLVEVISQSELKLVKGYVACKAFDADFLFPSESEMGLKSLYYEKCIIVYEKVLEIQKMTFNK